MWPHYPLPLPRSHPPKHSSVLFREHEIDRQLGLQMAPSWRDRVANRLGQTLVRLGTQLIERSVSPNGEVGVNDARPT